MIRQITATNNKLLFDSRRGRVFFGLIIMALIVLASVARISAQRVYGVSARRTTVVSNGSTTVARSTTVVTVGRPVQPMALPRGYIAVLPSGYRVVSGGYYMVGSIRYRAQFYQGRTVYVRI
jgi:hypothetical protein